MAKVTIKGMEYPLAFTVGSAIEFTRVTGKEIDAANGVSDVGAILYACAKSASRAAHIPFSLEFEEFCDNLTLEDLNLINEVMPVAQAPTKETKKKGSK